MKNADEQLQFRQQTTRDGSLTAISAQFGETYHSVQGAETESRHVYLNHGLALLESPAMTILEMGFGTGLNALLTLSEAVNKRLKVSYVAYEKYPVNPDYLNAFPLSETGGQQESWFRRLHEASWDMEVAVTEDFTIHKIHGDIITLGDCNRFDLVYYDAFSPKTQPELWTADLFQRVYSAMKPGGIIVTYSCSGMVKKALRATGFRVERLPGPPRKKHMLRAFKPM